MCAGVLGAERARAGLESAEAGYSFFSSVTVSGSEVVWRQWEGECALQWVVSAKIHVAICFSVEFCRLGAAYLSELETNVVNPTPSCSEEVFAMCWRMWGGVAAAWQRHLKATWPSLLEMAPSFQSIWCQLRHWDFRWASHWTWSGPFSKVPAPKRQSPGRSLETRSATAKPHEADRWSGLPAPKRHCRTLPSDACRKVAFGAPARSKPRNALRHSKAPWSWPLERASSTKAALPDVTFWRL